MRCGSAQYQSRDETKELDKVVVCDMKRGGFQISHSCDLLENQGHVFCYEAARSDASCTREFVVEGGAVERLDGVNLLWWSQYWLIKASLLGFRC